MCTRYLLLEEHYRAVLARLGIGAPASFASRYNIGPGSLVPAIRAGASADSAAAPEAVMLRWGLARGAPAPVSEKIVNVRAESLSALPRFRTGAARRRCVLPASGFFEWEKVGANRRPYLFRRSDAAPLLLAGIWEDATPEQPDETVCAVITTEPNDVVGRVHTRMPVLLSLEECAWWLAPKPADTARLSTRMGSVAHDVLTATAVNPRMNNVRYDAPDCIEPTVAIDRDEPQLPLGL